MVFSMTATDRRDQENGRITIKTAISVMRFKNIPSDFTLEIKINQKGTEIC